MILPLEIKTVIRQASFERCDRHSDLKLVSASGKRERGERLGPIPTRVGGAMHS